MNNKEKIRAESGESDSVNERSADSMAESVRNLLHGMRNSVRRLIRNLALVTQVSAAALGVIDCGTTEESECFREKLFLNFDGQTIPCRDLREGVYSVYDFNYYCFGGAPDGSSNAIIEPYESSAAEKEKIVTAIRARFEPLGIEVFTDASLSAGANILTIGGSFGGIYGGGEYDNGNLRHDNIGVVVQGYRYLLYPALQYPRVIALVSIHESLHMLGMYHAAATDPHSIMARALPLLTPEDMQSGCLRGLNPDEAEVLATNLEGACNNQGVPFDVLKKAALLDSPEAIQACLDL